MPDVDASALSVHPAFVVSIMHYADPPQTSALRLASNGGEVKTLGGVGQGDSCSGDMASLIMKVVGVGPDPVTL